MHNRLYIRKDIQDFTILKAYEDGFIDKQDAIDLIKEQTKSWHGQVSDYCKAKFYLLGLIDDQLYMDCLNDLLIHEGKLKWYVDKIKDLPNVGEYLVSVLDNDSNFEWTSWTNYSINDLCYNLNKESYDLLLNHCYD